MLYLIAFGVVLVLAVLWWVVFRGAMKYPNVNNEFSRENVEKGGGPHIV